MFIVYKVIYATAKYTSPKFYSLSLPFKNLNCMCFLMYFILCLCTIIMLIFPKDNFAEAPLKVLVITSSHLIMLILI